MDSLFLTKVFALNVSLQTSKLKCWSLRANSTVLRWAIGGGRMEWASLMEMCGPPVIMPLLLCPFCCVKTVLLASREGRRGHLGSRGQALARDRACWHLSLALFSLQTWEKNIISVQIHLNMSVLEVLCQQLRCTSSLFSGGRNSVLDKGCWDAA